ncbi:MAG: glutamate ligase domain-containing protein, partial [Chloroflexota bacterium]
SGPAGARRVLGDPAADIALLETARGGILLRGLACQSFDVSVLTNVTADHLGLHGIHTVEGLAKVKSVVIRVTRPGGWAVLNADDPLVRGAAAATHASRFWFSRDPANPHVLADLNDGGRAMLAADGWITEASGSARGDARTPILPIAEVPITFGGRALHMVENALAAAAALRALGLSPEQVAAGLRDFGSDPAHNPGRNDLYRVNGGTVLIDYAHNEAGVLHMWDLARSFVEPGGKLTGVVGSAGDRTDEIIRALGRIAAEKADEVLIKETQRYLRGRESNDPINLLFIEGFREAGKDPLAIIETEGDALRWAIARMHPGDVVAVMCFEDPPGTRAIAASLAG